MGDATAGFSGTVEVSTDDTTYNELGGCYDVSFGQSFNLLDSTDFSDEFMERIQGLGDASPSASCNYSGSDTGQGNVETQFDGGLDIYIKVLWDGTNGIKAKCLVENIDDSSAVDGKVEREIQFQLNDGTGWTRLP